ncbi:DUF550 domain-containing protein [Salmonella enterica]|nr:DUF550 domain-containing protein [Salmonella enterica]EIG1168630.1 DUF550 domain-containing protein [Salmonella enterica subsp. diarizonae serovar 48:k:z53]HAU3318250.1 DUF550 domain-containing protein [Salmonella enterica subsp. diarizonae]EEM0617052.1 DUF550 domain-containing protein [Salmonella enterica]EIF5383253.1 DUF550 domain-containing protein [Salmonella enterica]
MTTITREQQKQILIDTANHVISRDNTSPYSENLRELARIALASLESEPVAYIFKHPAGELFWSLTDESNKGQNDVMPVYAAPPAPEREHIRREHAEWSYKTFGDVGPIGPLKHLSKEALEAAAEPDDLSEWADMQFLLWDAQRRAGITDKQITRAMVEKLEINKSRQWPEPKDGEPRLHIKKHPAPVVPEEITADGIIGMHECGFVEGWNACRTAMLNGDIFRENSISSTNNFREIAETSTNSPVIPDGWIICSERMPEKGAYISAVSKHGEYVAGQVIDDWLDLHDGTSFGLDEVYLWMMLPPLPESPQQ